MCEKAEREREKKSTSALLASSHCVCVIERGGINGERRRVRGEDEEQECVFGHESSSLQRLQQNEEHFS